MKFKLQVKAAKAPYKQKYRNTQKKVQQLTTTMYSVSLSHPVAVHNCFTLATTNKLVVNINSLKVPKIKKILLYEIKFLVPNYSCLQNP